MTTAIISLKQCQECEARAPIGWDLVHRDTCSGSPNICDIVRGPWEMEPGDEVVIVAMPS